MSPPVSWVLGTPGGAPHRVTVPVGTAENRSVAEWPPLPIVTDFDPDAVEAERLEDEKHDDQGSEDDEIPVEHVQGVALGLGSGCHRAEVGASALGKQNFGDVGEFAATLGALAQPIREVLDQFRQQDHEERAHHRASDGAGSSDEQDGDELDR